MIERNKERYIKVDRKKEKQIEKQRKKIWKDRDKLMERERKTD